MLKTGDDAPEFELLDHEGRKVTSTSLRGRRYVLWFYPKADTPGCTKEGCGFRDHAPAYAKKGVDVFGVSFDAPADNKAFAAKFQFPFRLLSDVDRKLAIACGAAEDASAKSAKRLTFVIGANGRVEQAIETKDPAGQAASLLQTL
jgi:thioredoxin-dependent peroxiredoxin